MGDPKPKQGLKPELDTSGVRTRSQGAEHDEAAERAGDGSFGQAVIESVRAALELARLAGTPVSITLRGDPARGLPMRVIEGVVLEIGLAVNGRERVVIGVAEDTSQFVLLERIVRVASTG